jgi:protein kinase X
MCPQGYYGKPPTHVDIFGFAVILYVLLENRFPFGRDLLPSFEEQVAAKQNHCSEVFDTLTDSSLNSSFGGVVANCFTASYRSGEELVKALESAYKSWSKEVSGYAVTRYWRFPRLTLSLSQINVKGANAHNIPYPKKPKFIKIEPVPPSMVSRSIFV